jgi:calnexin
VSKIGFEIWTMQNDILFDNIYIGHSIADAEKFAQETFHVKHAVEKAVELASKPKEEDKPKSPLDLTFTEDPVTFIKQKVDLFITIAKQDPIEAIKFVPEVAIGAAVGALTILGVLIGLLTIGGPTPAQVQKAGKNAKAAAKDGKDKVASAAASAVDQGKAEVNKRTTRSNASD